MQENKLIKYLKGVVQNVPSDWLNLTTHRLDIYDESLAKVQFLEQFELMYHNNIFDTKTLNALPTAYDYIRLGHPLSSVMEWAIAKKNGMEAENVISFTSMTIPIMAILRANLLENKSTRILYSGKMPSCFNEEILKAVYRYDFTLEQVKSVNDISEDEISTIYIMSNGDLFDYDLGSGIDFCINLHEEWGSVLLVNGSDNDRYIPEIQHVRRRETIAMTPISCYRALQCFVDSYEDVGKESLAENKEHVVELIDEITQSATKALLASSGLSIQYAIMMGLIHDAHEKYGEKAVKFIVPPNCYGGTNDQARRVAACLPHVEIVDLPVDGENDMVQSVDKVLAKIADGDAVPFIIAEIPTNPRVEVPDLVKLEETLRKERFTKSGRKAVDPVFILDQTFCPNVNFLGEGAILSTVRALSYASGSKFPSGGKCTAGYCVANKLAEGLMDKISIHLELCDNEATDFQYEILAAQLPSMNQRIHDAYLNTREFVTYIEEVLPEAKINFVSEDLASQGFTPSVFSMDLPTKGDTEVDREEYKRKLNLQLIQMMITEIPDESKYCVSYGQLKGCYWTIPATSTQGTTKEGDKDYIIRAALSPNMDLEHHKNVFKKFVESL